jgi:NAD+ kinase
MRVHQNDWHFKRVILYARHHYSNRTVMSAIKKLIKFFKEIHFPIFLEASTSLRFDIDMPTLTNDHFQKDTDLLIVIGGDGSLLSAARLASEKAIAVIGVNRGHLGFLTDIMPNHMFSELEAVLKGNFICEERLLLRVRLFDDKQLLMEGRALNDLVLSRGQSAYLVEFNVYIDNQFVTHYRADGLILSTPTGSTAYNLSAGGPIMHPQLRAFSMVPMFSHSLNARPLVISDESKIEIKINTENQAPLAIYLDGNQTHVAHPGQHLVIDRHPQNLKLLHPSNYLYYDTLRIKLGWGSEESC